MAKRLADVVFAHSQKHRNVVSVVAQTHLHLSLARVSNLKIIVGKSLQICILLSILEVSTEKYER